MKALRSVLIALLLSLVFGLLVGTWLSLRLERPTLYIGALTPSGSTEHGAPPLTA